MRWKASGCVVAVVGVILLATAGIWVLNHNRFADEYIEVDNLSSSDFAAKYPPGHFAKLEGASAISLSGRYTRDSYNLWYRVVMSKSVYEEAWRERDRELRERGYDYSSGRSVQLCRVVDVGEERVDDWPLPEYRKPRWWYASWPNHNECTAWQNGALKPLRGEIWIFDNERKVLWIWQWSCQYR
jgi:hypothetical protein